ncbi:AraC family transcriptional regulator [Paenibacillus kobensis]|uniref:AraC family transcriptional regulator n=1 Tax=Paenibacillus kobensis TaxID=59841 RepID=UPI000FD6E599|nr:AraC family transcriptional regulator [Paenibacillus kobensis]
MNEQYLFVERIKRSHPFAMSNQMEDSYEMYYLLSGGRRYFVRDQTYTVEPGTLVLIPPGVIHRTIDAPGVPGHERILVQFSNSYIDHGMHVMPLHLEAFNMPSPLLPFTGEEKLQIERLLHQLCEEFSANRSGREPMLQALMSQLLLSVGRAMRQNSSRNVLPDSASSPSEERIQPVIDHILAHCAEPLGLEETAAMFYFSPAHLSRLFRRSTGFTYSEFVQLVRIRNAQELLRTTDRKVLEIAESSGFGNLSHFQHMFRKHVGMTPLKYRKEVRI